MPPLLVDLIGISKTYGAGSTAVRALADISLTVEPGEFIGFQGPSGCGKSTLLNIVGLCEEPSSGDYRLRGRQMNGTPESAKAAERRSTIGFVFQHFNLVQSLTAVENVSLLPLLNGAAFTAAQAAAMELLTDVGLAVRAAHLPAELSGGEMQRVAVCRALAHRPALILADEPTGNLDTAAGARIIELLRSAASNGAAVLMASHSDEALRSCDRVIQMRDGTTV